MRIYENCFNVAHNSIIVWIPVQTRVPPTVSLSTDGAQREGRTPTLLREPDFESGASASSAIRADYF